MQRLMPLTLAPSWPEPADPVWVSWRIRVLSSMTPRWVWPIGGGGLWGLLEPLRAPQGPPGTFSGRKGRILGSGSPSCAPLGAVLELS
eukprot:2266251-Pyramimonas_sp.AAC.1